MPAQTIDEVIQELDGIIADAYERRSRLGFFPALYRRVTAAVRDGIRDGFFDDGPRMERLDVIFANRYLEAFHRHTRGEPPTASWRAAFDAAERSNLIILQHLFLGINAHINLDLGIAAAETAPGDGIDALEGDFDRINAVLSDLLDTVQEGLDEVSPWLGLLDMVAGRADEDFAEFSLEAARDHAWLAAQRLARAGPEARERDIATADKHVAGLAHLIVGLGPLTRLFARVVRARESRDVRRIIRVLTGGVPALPPERV